MKIFTFAIALFVSCWAADFVFGSVVVDVGFTWQSIGNVGNAPDPTVRRGGASGFGSVDYHYKITKNPITNNDYVEFLNAVATVSDPGGLYTYLMKFSQGGIERFGEEGNRTYAAKPTWGNRPVNYVDVYDSMRYINWLNNGKPVGLQGVGTTESGSYTITQSGIDLHNITRNSGPGMFLPTEDEWYKAAYHEPIAGGDYYWTYPTRSDILPSPGVLDANFNLLPGENIANYDNQGNLATVGTAGPLSDSYYGVEDMAGHVWEWTETIITAEEFTNPSPPSSNPPSNGTWQAIMGGYRSARVDELDHIAKTFRHPEDPFDGDCCRGFRVVSISVPEPTSFALASAVFVCLSAGRRRRIV